MPKNNLLRFKGVEDKILEVLKDKGKRTTNQILKDIIGDYEISWVTVRRYLKILEEKKKVSSICFGERYNVIFWEII